MTNAEQLGARERVLLAENERLRQALIDIWEVSRDEGLAHMVNWMRGRAIAASRRLEDAVTQAEQRAASLLSLAAEDLRITWEYQLDPGDLEVVQEVRHYQGALADAQMEYNAALRRAIRQLNQVGYTDRDA